MKLLSTALTYYDELGLPRSASVEEIRESYRQLARLLHPDKLQQDRQRQIAECQMKRLNCVYQILSDPLRRAQYDETLGASPVAAFLQGVEIPAERVFAKMKAFCRPQHAVWIAAGVMIVAAALWAISLREIRPTEYRDLKVPSQPVSEPAPPLDRNPARGSRAPVSRYAAEAVNLRRQLEQSLAETDSAWKQIAGLRRQLAELEKRIPGSEPVVAAQPELSPMPWFEIPTLQPPPASLAGNWHYLKTKPNQQGRDLYPPEFIEAVILEDDGALQGRYRARYKVADRAISPDVVFHFGGARQNGSASLSWLGAGGARGEVRLKLLSENALEIAWVARDLGKTQGLGSGIAVLVRRQEP